MRSGVAAVLATVLAAGVTVLVLMHQHRGPATAPIGQGSIASTATATVDPNDQVEGLTPNTAVGSCFSVTASGTNRLVHFLACGAPHTYELVALERAGGSGSSYPANTYWNGPVAQRCYQDLRAYSGRTRDEWPDDLSSDEFVPLPEGWRSGDRTVFCLAHRRPDQRGSARHLPAAGRHGIAPSSVHAPSSHKAPLSHSTPATAPSSSSVPLQQTVVGRLYLAGAGSDVCLGIRTPGYTGPVSSSTSAYTWHSAVDGAGDALAGKTGISRGHGPIVWHLGDRVALTGQVITGVRLTTCATTSQFDLTSVRSAG